MKKLLVFCMIFCLLFCTACRPEGTTGEGGEDITANPNAGKQPVTIDPSEEQEVPPDSLSSELSKPDPTPLAYSKNLTELSADYAGKEIGYVMEDEFIPALSDFALRFAEVCTTDGKNTLISPVSALFALGMTQHGAAGETKAQMQKAFLGEYEDLDLQHSLAGYRAQFASSETVELACSLWFREKAVEANKDFLQRNADYFDADIFSAPFDESTVQDVNAWVSNHTRGLIPQILTTPPRPETAMYLINTLAFEAQWHDPFSDHQITDEVFTAADGTQQKVRGLNGKEDNYFENELCTGFSKSYKGGERFVALLPKEGTTPEQLIASLDGKGWQSLLTPKANSEVSFTLPKFKTECMLSLVEPLKEMGVTLAFDGEKADFSEMGTAYGYPMYISDALQKTVFELDENGTKAAAVTIVTMEASMSAPMDPPQQYEVILDRPFVYAIVDRDNIPLFLGIANSME